MNQICKEQKRTGGDSKQREISTFQQSQQVGVPCLVHRHSARDFGGRSLQTRNKQAEYVLSELTSHRKRIFQYIRQGHVEDKQSSDRIHLLLYHTEPTAAVNGSQGGRALSSDLDSATVDLLNRNFPPLQEWAEPNVLPRTAVMSSFRVASRGSTRRMAGKRASSSRWRSSSLSFTCLYTRPARRWCVVFSTLSCALFF